MILQPFQGWSIVLIHAPQGRRALSPWSARQPWASHIKPLQGIFFSTIGGFRLQFDVLSPEQQILICIARRELDDPTRDRFKKLLLELDKKEVRSKNPFDSLYPLAHAHGLAPLLYHHWSQLEDTDQKPANEEPETKNDLKSDFLKNAQNNLFYLRQLSDLLVLFEKNNVPVIPFKGPLLAVQVYGNPALRQFVDLDILVKKSDIQNAKQLLRQLGYQQTQPIPPDFEDKYIAIQCEMHFKHPTTEVYLELHWNFVPHYFVTRFDFAKIWKNSRIETIGGLPSRTLHPADYLLALCVHGQKHFWNKLELIATVNQWIQNHPDLDWRQVLEDAGTTGAVTALLTGLRISQEIFQTPLPPSVQEKMEGTPQLPRLVKLSMDMLWGRNPDFGLKNRLLYPFRLKDNNRDRLIYAWRSATGVTNGDWEFMKLPRALYVLYYVIRPVRLIWQRVVLRRVA